jgi:hypothetical protein
MVFDLFEEYAHGMYIKKHILQFVIELLYREVVVRDILDGFKDDF